MACLLSPLTAELLFHCNSIVTKPPPKKLMAKGKGSLSSNKDRKRQPQSKTITMCLWDWMLLNVRLSEKVFVPVVLNGFFYFLSLCLDFYFLLFRHSSHTTFSYFSCLSICVCVCFSHFNSFCLLHSPILSNCKVIGALKPPTAEIYLPPRPPRPSSIYF